MSDSDKIQPIIIVRKKKRGAAAHHGGSWKVAYADFVTAMMAFFMVMWLVATMPQEKLGGIADYFKNPSAVEGTTSTLSPGKMGPGGAGDSAIKMFTEVKNPPGAGKMTGIGQAGQSGSSSGGESAQIRKEQERKRLEALQKVLEEAISKSLAMAPFKDQLLIDLTPEGLRIQIVDAQNRPMFDLSSPTLKGYTNDILHELAGYLDKVDNRIAISGHTDDTPFSGQAAQQGFSNWELSTMRANSARRALVSGGLRVEKLARIVGLAESVPFDKTNRRNPINRRISIVVLDEASEAVAARVDEPRRPGDGRPADPPPIPAVLPAKPLSAGIGPSRAGP